MWHSLVQGPGGLSRDTGPLLPLDKLVGCRFANGGIQAGVGREMPSSSEQVWDRHGGS